MKLSEYKLHPFAWPGCYTVLAIMDDGEAMCHKCATTEAEVHEGGERDGWRFEGTYIHWEGEPDICANCGADLPSEYGEVTP